MVYRCVAADCNKSPHYTLCSGVRMVCRRVAAGCSSTHKDWVSLLSFPKGNRSHKNILLHYAASI